LEKKWGIFIKLGLKAAENKGWRIREAIKKERRKLFMSVKWKPKCTLCGSIGCSSTHTDGNYPGHDPKMSGRCPKNPTGGNFGHKPRWVKS